MGNRATIDSLLNFLSDTLNLYIELERENAEYQRTIARLQNPSMAAGGDRRMNLWVAHEDPGFLGGMQKLAPRLNLLPVVVVQTGGEIMDRLSSAKPDILVLGDSLPDLPVEFLIDSLESEVRRAVLVQVLNWGEQTERSTRIVGPYGEPSVDAPMQNANDLVVALTEARRRVEHVELTRDFARHFKERHADFIARYNEVRAMVERLG